MYVRGTVGGALSAYEAMVMDQATGTHVVVVLTMGREARQTHCKDKITKEFQWACQFE